MPQFFRYLFIGLLCASLEYGSFLLGHHGLNWGLVWANTFAYALGLVSSFALNKYWVFSGQQKTHTHYQFVAYCALALVNYSLGTWLLLYLVQSIALYAWLAKGLSMVAIVTWNFVIYKKVIYR